jgi:hypothetical protein
MEVVEGFVVLDPEQPEGAVGVEDELGFEGRAGGVEPGINGDIDARGQLLRLGGHRGGVGQGRRRGVLFSSEKAPAAGECAQDGE